MSCCIRLYAIGLSLALLLAVVPASSAACVILCPTPTPSPSPAASVTGPPVVTGFTIDAVTATSVTVSATIDPDGLQTTWNFFAGPAHFSLTAMLTSSPTGHLSAGSVPVTVRATLTGLLPGNRYGASIDATNQAKQVGTGLPFSTPELPRLRVTLALVRQFALIGGGYSFDAIVHGSDDGDLGKLEGEPVGSRRYRVLQSVAVVKRRLPFTTTLPDNGRYRVVLTGNDGRVHRRPSVSNSVFLYVFPRSSLELEPTTLNSAYIAATFRFNVRPVGRGFVGEPAYFYRARSRRGPFVRFAAVPLRARGFGDEEVGARAVSPVSGEIVIRACIRHQLLPDMGVPFTYRDCGNAVL